MTQLRRSFWRDDGGANACLVWLGDQFLAIGPIFCNLQILLNPVIIDTFIDLFVVTDCFKPYPGQILKLPKSETVYAARKAVCGDCFEAELIVRFDCVDFCEV
jgi:hypothetical protein